MNLLTRAMALLAVLALTACAAQNPKTSAEVSAAIKVQDSDFDSSRTYLGPYVSEASGSGFFRDHFSWRIRAFQDKKTGDVRRQLYVNTSNIFGWRFYRTASFSGGDIVRADRISSEPSCSRNGCTYYETVGAIISQEKWLSAGGGVLQVRFNAQSGNDIIVSISPEYRTGIDQALSLQSPQLDSRASGISPVSRTPSLPETSPPPTPGRSKIGRSSSAVEGLVRKQACHDMPVANLISSGPGYENYSVACSNGDTIMYRCEFGNCRALK